MVTKNNRDYIGELATQTGHTREEVCRALDNLLYGDGAVYRQMIDIPLHGKGD